MLSAPIFKGSRIEYDLRLGLASLECGRARQRIAPRGGEVLYVHSARGQAWVLLDGEVQARLVALDDLRAGAPRPGCAGLRQA